MPAHQNVYPWVAASSTFLAATLIACGTPPPDLDVRLKRMSERYRFMVEMEAPATGPSIGKIHSWTLRLATPDGSPVSHAHIAITGGMPQHGHGLPTQPRVTAEPLPGTYVIDGMKFSMTGWWNLGLDIDAAGVQDRAVFNVVLDDAGLRR